MSQPPQPPSWGDPIGEGQPVPPPQWGVPPAGQPGYPPAGYPPQPWPGPPAPPAKEMSNRSRFWIGFLLVLPATFVYSTLTGIAATTIGGTAGDVVGSVLGLVAVVAVVIGVVVERTRWFVVGMLAGAAVLAVLAGIALLILLNSFLEIFS